VSDSDLAKQVDEVLGDKVLADPETLWLHVEGIHGAAQALGVTSVCAAVSHLAAMVHAGLADDEVPVRMAEFVETQGSALRAWLGTHGIVSYQPWIMHQTAEGDAFFKQWTIQP